MGTLRIGRRTIRYVVKRRDSKYAHLRFGDDLHLEVTVPLASKIAARDILRKKRAWVETAYQKLANSRRVFDGRRILLKGVPHRLKLVKARSPQVKVRDGTILVGVPSGTDPRQSIREWMRRETEKYATKRVRYYSRKLGFNAPGVEVTEAKRWGHCTRDGKLAFGWQLAALPKDLADYVILHEISHLSEFNHDRRFHHRLLSLSPDYREKGKSLRGIVALQDIR